MIFSIFLPIVFPCNGTFTCPQKQSFFFFSCNPAFSDFLVLKTKPILPKGHAAKTLCQVMHLVPKSYSLASGRNTDYLHPQKLRVPVDDLMHLPQSYGCDSH